MSATQAIQQVLQVSRSLGLSRLAIVTYIFSSLLIKASWIITAQQGQPFNAWFFPAFQAPPYSTWFHYHGLTWLAGPYSLAWYFLNLPAVGGYWVFNLYVLIVDFLFTIVFYRRSPLYAVYWATISPWFILIDPVDFWIVALILTARYFPVLLIIGPMIKFPFGAPLWVWQWVLTNPNSLHGVENWGRYLLLGVIWTASLGMVLYEHHKHPKTLRDTLLPKLSLTRINRSDESPR